MKRRYAQVWTFVPLLFLLCCASLLAQNSMQGVVTRAGSSDPLSKVRLELHADASDSVLDDITTEDDGRFFFQNLRPGRYRLVASRSGYVRPPLIVRVEPGQQTIDIRVAMTLTGAIYGTVYDAKGTPLANTLVQALKATYPQGGRVLVPAQSVQTNDLGEYRFFWLPPGRYYVAAIPPGAEPGIFGMLRLFGFGINMFTGPTGRAFFTSGSPDPAVTPEVERNPVDGEVDRYVPVYFSGAIDEQLASPIDLRAGAELGGINIVVTPVLERHVRGIVINSATGKPPQYPTLDDSLHRREGPNVDPATGAFDILLLPGIYTLMANSADGNGIATVRVGDSDINNVTILTAPNFNISGRLTVDGRGGNASDIGELRISLRRSGPEVRGEARPSSYSRPLADGSFTLEGKLGDYLIDIASLPPNAYVKSIRLGRVDVLNTGLHLERLPDTLLQIDLGKNPGVIEGAAEKPDIPVLLVPDVRQRSDLYRATMTEPFGRFRFDKLPPGMYKVFAFTELEDGAWFDPEFLRNYESRGTPVSVDEGKTQQIQVMVN